MNCYLIWLRYILTYVVEPRWKGFHLSLSIALYLNLKKDNDTYAHDSFSHKLWHKDRNTFSNAAMNNISFD